MVKCIDWHVLVDDGFGDEPEFLQAREDVLAGIEAIHWPPGGVDFTIQPGKHVNGVKPIKDAFVTVLQERDWELERIQKIDAILRYDNGTPPFAVEWETGNISSSHRAVNRLANCMIEGTIAGGVLIVPSGALYPHLTDRIGNFPELVRYLPLWRRWAGTPGFRYLAIAVVEHDGLDVNVPAITKGTDGRALV